MAVRQYVGARYVPDFASPLDWDNSKTYEPLTIVYYKGNSYTSRQSVPKGIDITNEDHWALTGNYNAQIEQYRQEVAACNQRIDTNTQAIEDLGNDLEVEEAARIAAVQAEEKARIAAVQSEEKARIAADKALEAMIAEATTEPLYFAVTSDYKGNNNTIKSIVSRNGCNWSQVDIPLPFSGVSAEDASVLEMKDGRILVACTSLGVDHQFKYAIFDPTVGTWSNQDVTSDLLNGYSAVWAPCFFYDANNDMKLVIGLGNTPNITDIYGGEHPNIQQYLFDVDTENDVFVLSNKRVLNLSSGGSTCFVDADVIFYDSVYYLLCKNQKFLDITLFSSTDLATWSVKGENITGIPLAEGPGVLKVNAHNIVFTVQKYSDAVYQSGNYICTLDISDTRVAIKPLTFTVDSVDNDFVAQHVKPAIVKNDAMLKLINETVIAPISLDIAPYNACRNNGRAQLDETAKNILNAMHTNNLRVSLDPRFAYQVSVSGITMPRYRNYFQNYAPIAIDKPSEYDFTSRDRTTDVTLSTGMTKELLLIPYQYELTTVVVNRMQ